MRDLTALVPQLQTPPRLDPTFITDEDLEDLSTFFGLSRAACLDRLKAYSWAEMAARWRAADTQTPDQLLAFYREADLYIWELMQWHASLGRRSYWQTLAQVVQRFPPDAGFRRVLDYGCGIGTDGLFLALSGYDVALMDVDGPAFRFAKHRFERRGVPGLFVEVREALPILADFYDIIICFDVFEHLLDPLGAAERLVRALRPEGVLVQTGTFSDDGVHPCHLHQHTERFSGLRWHIYMAGLGLWHDGVGYRSAPGILRIVQRLRFAVWRAFGLWIARVRRSADTATRWAE